MEYTKLGNTDIEVSRICLGCMGFGDPGQGQHTWTLPEEPSREVIRHALDSGINFFDTAIGYQNGTSEEYVGRALRDFANRDDVVIATKFVPRSDQEIADGVTMQQHIANSIDGSLRRLETDHVDLYVYHMWDYRSDLFDVMDGLNEVVRSGKARAIGISNCFAYQLARANDLAAHNGFARFATVQNHYNLIFREEEREMANLCLEDGVAMTPYSALAGGRLSRRPGVQSKRLAEDAFARLKYDATQEQDAVVIARVEQVAQERGVSMAEVSLAWLLTKVAAPIAGATKASHVDTAVNAASLRLTPEEVAFLEEPYVPHALVGVLAQNTAQAANQKHVWSR